MDESDKKEDLLERVMAAIVGSVPDAALERALSRARTLRASGAGTSRGTGPGAATSTPPAAPAAPAGDLASRLLLVDLLDDDIVSAGPGSKAYPLRVLFAQIGGRLATTGFELACALNVFFRVDADEENKMRLGVLVSRLYYRFVRDEGMEPALVLALSPLLASLLSGQLERVRLESVDHQKVFDGGAHERAPGSDGASARIREPVSFLCRVPGTGMVRLRAEVLT